MKGGKDEEKNMSPMFPRLHVGDTEKGGPRAPPRNKMALYEQLSVPSQRLNFGSASKLPAPRNNAAPLVPVAPWSQGLGHERTAFPPFYIPPTPADSEGNTHSQSSDGMYLRTKVDKSEPKITKLMTYKNSDVSVLLSSNAECVSFPLSNSKSSCPNNPGNDNDFRVPMFVNPGITPSSNKDQHNEEREMLTHLNPIRPSRSTETSGNSTQKAASATCNSSAHLHSARDKHLKRTNTTDLWSKHVKVHSEDNPLESVTSKGRADRIAFDPFTRETFAEPSKHSYVSPNHEHRSSPFDDLGGLRHKDNNGQLQEDHRAGFLAENIPHSNGIVAEPVALMRKGNDVLVRSEFPSRDTLGNDRGSCNENREDQIHGFVQVTDMDRNDDASETSMVDSISAFDISPDDVVGVIGQKHFWKARRAILNQQRLFGVQVFELHRLIKVQKLIAGSPHLLLEDTAYLSKPALKASPAKKQPAEYLLKSAPQIVKQRAESKKPNQIECAVENAVAKLPLPSVSGGVNREHVNQQSIHGQHHGNPTPPPVADGNKTGWSFQPPSGNQWLVPVMSPSEGLVYKPYTGPCPPTAGFMAPLYGGCGPMTLPSMGGEFPSPYGIPAPHHQGIGVFPNAPPFAQPYFSPYGMQMMGPVISASSVEHANPFAGAQPCGHAEQISTGEGNFNVLSRTSCNVSNQKSEAISSGFPKFQTSKENEIQGSTASSPDERAHKEQAGNVSQGRDALPLFPMASAVTCPDEHPETQNSDRQHTRVIKVVPHNPRSATESAARIFQSIQEERQQ